MSADFNGDGRFDGADMQFLGQEGPSGNYSGGCGCGSACGGCLIILGFILLCSLLFSCTVSCMAG